jgi:hypothetical protein
MSDEEDEIPDLVPATLERVPITIITGFLGIFPTLILPHPNHMYTKGTHHYNHRYRRYIPHPHPTPNDLQNLYTHHTHIIPITYECK